jgi:hypothetical protein
MSLVFLFWNASMARLPDEVIISYSIAGAVLRSIWIIDRACLLIPDRLQLLGLLSALSFLGIQLYFGAHWDEAFLEIGFAIGQVALLWLLSIAYFKVRKTIGFGLGDIKLLGWIAIFAGQRLTYVIVGAIGLGILTLAVVSIKNSIQNRRLTIPSGTDAFAFGPQIIAALVIDGILFNG